MLPRSFKQCLVRNVKLLRRTSSTRQQLGEIGAMRWHLFPFFLLLLLKSCTMIRCERRYYICLGFGFGWFLISLSLSLLFSCVFLIVASFPISSFVFHFLTIQRRRGLGKEKKNRALGTKQFNQVLYSRAHLPHRTATATATVTRLPYRAYKGQQ